EERFPGRWDVAPGAWDSNHRDGVSATVPAGNVTATSGGFSGDGEGIIHVFDADDGGPISPGGYVRRWNLGAWVEYEIPAPGISRFCVMHDRRAGGGVLTVTDLDNVVVLGTIDLSDADGEGAALWCVTMPLGARTIRIECTDGGSGTNACRTL